MLRFVGLLAVVGLFLSSPAGAQEKPYQERIGPWMQVIPQPYSQAAVMRGKDEIARYWFGSDLRRPFLFPLVGPSGASVTRMGHPHDPNGHSHHNSVWISHNDVNGVVFWGDSGKGKIVHRRVLQYDDTNEQALIQVQNAWIDEATGKTLLDEIRTMRFRPNAPEAKHPYSLEWLLVIDIELSVPPTPEKNGQVTLGKTPFGMIGVRMAKNIGVHDGGGRILNSEGGVDEKEVFWKRAKWVDYSGRNPRSSFEGITLFDHPDNPNHPSYFHVRDDGWMGASLTHDAERVIKEGSPLKLRYGLWVHFGRGDAGQIEKKFAEFSQIEDPPEVKKK